ncbi:MAG: PTS mannitol transporter subunit IIBC, partial [Carnobacterium sp.]
SGGIVGILTFSLFNVGLVGPVSPGSILAILTLTPRGDYLGIIVGILTAASVSFSISVFIIKFSKVSLEIDLSTKKQMGELKRVSKPSKIEAETTNEVKNFKQTSEFPEIVNKIIFAYDVEIGTSAMGASILRRKMQEAGMEIEICHALIDQILKDSGTIMITQQELTLHALKKFPESYHISVVSFMKNKEYDALIKKLS